MKKNLLRKYFMQTNKHKKSPTQTKSFPIHSSIKLEVSRILHRDKIKIPILPNLSAQKD